MKVLAIDTVGEAKSFGLAVDGRLVAEASFRGDLHVDFWPRLEGFLAVNGQAVAGIDLFAVNRGPGSWTGLRFGLAVVKGWAAAAGRCVFALSGPEIATLPSRPGTSAGALALAAEPGAAVPPGEITPLYGRLPRFRKLGE